MNSVNCVHKNILMAMDALKQHLLRMQYVGAADEESLACFQRYGISDTETQTDLLAEAKASMEAIRAEVDSLKHALQQQARLIVSQRTRQSCCSRQRSRAELQQRAETHRFATDQ
jgi:hypothetical protein